MRFVQQAASGDLEYAQLKQIALDPFRCRVDGFKLTVRRLCFLVPGPLGRGRLATTEEPAFSLPNGEPKALPVQAYSAQGNHW